MSREMRTWIFETPLRVSFDVFYMKEMSFDSPPEALSDAKSINGPSVADSYFRYPSYRLSDRAFGRRGERRARPFMKRARLGSNIGAKWVDRKAGMENVLDPAAKSGSVHS